MVSTPAPKIARWSGCSASSMYNVLVLRRWSEWRAEFTSCGYVWQQKAPLVEGRKSSWFWGKKVDHAQVTVDFNHHHLSLNFFKLKLYISMFGVGNISCLAKVLDSGQ